MSSENKNRLSFFVVWYIINIRFSINPKIEVEKMNQQPMHVQILDSIYRNQCLKYHTISYDNQNVCDSLESEIEKWNLYPILINAPTGSGKSSFVFNVLANHANQEKKSVLVLSNRLALNLQQKVHLCDLYDLPPIGSKTLSDIKFFRNVILLTYQAVLHELTQNSFAEMPIKYIVFDEAHFFCSDAIFNPWTESILLSLQTYFPKAIRIYMSATPENVKPIISAFEKRHFDMLRNRTNVGYNTPYDNFLDTQLLHQEFFMEYKFQENFQNISILFFYEWDSLLERIKAYSNSTEVFPDQDKWLIFVSEKEAGKQLKKSLGKDLADYIDADSPPKYIAELSRRQFFDKKVLISTSVIDNGISIQDSKLKNIVIDTTDRIQLIQMLGRKRLAANEQITLYVKLTSEIKDISDYRQVAENLYSTIASYEKNPSYFMYSNWGTLTTGQQNLFAPQFQNDGLVLGTNIFAKYQLALSCYIFEQLEDQLKTDEFAFAKQVCSWLHKEFSPNMLLEQTPIAKIVEKLTAILDTKLGIDITSPEGITDLVNELKGQLPPSETKKLGFKNDNANRNAADIRKIIEKYDLPYTLSNKKQGKYHLEKVIPSAKP